MPNAIDRNDRLKSALSDMDSPRVPWKVWVQIAIVFVVLWGLALGLQPWIHGWGIGVVGAVTVAAAGFGIYAWRMARKSKGVMRILQGAVQPGGREKALQELQERATAGKGDAVAALAQAQLLAQDNPQLAMRTLEGIDLKKAPSFVQDDVRANLALLYLMHNRIKDARGLADDIRLDRQPQAQAKGLYAAVVAETFARTGKADEARKLLETFDPSDASFGDARAMLYRAQVYTFYATKNRGLAKTAMTRLHRLEPNMVASFLARGVDPRLSQLARTLLGPAAMPKQRMVRAR